MRIEQKAEKKVTEILIGEKIWERETFCSLLQSLGKQWVLITDSVVKKLWGEKIVARLQEQGLPIILIDIPAGEESKTREVKQQLEDLLLAKQFGRTTCLIALGGGVVTDLVGFLASTYARGIPFIALPTTLLGMVDASLGGKTGVNTPHGKNLIGSFYPPRALFFDLTFLATQTENEWRNGAAEIIKHGLIGSKSLFNFLRDHPEKWEKKESAFLKKIITLSCQEKKKVVEEDYREEKGLRRILNFGHTFGHAVERLLDYRIGHGDAVAIGMAHEAYLSMRMGYLSQKELSQILELLHRFGFKLKWPSGVDEEKLKQAMLLDKKASDGKVRFVLLKCIGKTLSFKGEYCTPVEPALIHEAIAWRIP